MDTATNQVEKKGNGKNWKLSEKSRTNAHKANKQRYAHLEHSDAFKKQKIEYEKSNENR